MAEYRMREVVLVAVLFAVAIGWWGEHRYFVSRLRSYEIAIELLKRQVEQQQAENKVLINNEAVDTSGPSDSYNARQ